MEIKMEGTHLRIPSGFMHDKRIHPKERSNLFAVLGAFWSFAGKGNTCYPGIGKTAEDFERTKKTTLCSRSGLGKNSVVKAKKRLAELGWIQVTRVGQGKNDLVLLLEKPIEVGAVVYPSNVQTPVKGNSETFNEDSAELQNSSPMAGSPESVPQGEASIVQEHVQLNIEEHIPKAFVEWAKGKLSRSSVELIVEAYEKQDTTCWVNPFGLNQPSTLHLIFKKWMSEKLTVTT
ncbi:helix-turn-helix domain-containing protein [Leptospira andrefontaineae]|nr:helix-turn-helix domain-containing protein [Leptospira andrefontaineae]